MDKKLHDKIVDSLSNTLPSLVASITSLLEHVENEKEVFNKQLLINLVKVNKDISKSFDSFIDLQKSINDQIENVNKEEDKAVLNEIYQLFTGSHSKINEGTNALVFLLIKESNITNESSVKDWYNKNKELYEDYTMSDTINSLYKGTKLLTKLIDLVFS